MDTTLTTHLLELEARQEPAKERELDKFSEKLNQFFAGLIQAANSAT